ncbi:FAD/NAD(P)-binding domain-containing protein [Amniculicola lignicola CBS 123094]|uniref:FAD/NAD(P)-binding domain-containing protein n=1 Tax=Amniculicola lignicola CBS 123094 TaxID=1392246 RepID=A0A6A5WXW3_9PLEO|nr:FAD/NAD(P)-binding domain-containing protein [Amniculicola lignicola CBS 123094]
MTAIPIPNETLNSDTSTGTVPDYDVIIIGAGFSGIANLHRLREDGLKCHVFEAGSDFGGVWYWNRYPGARVDSETPFYQLSIPSVYTTFNFSSRFADHKEMRQYMAHVDKTLNLRKDVDFNSRVNSCTWDEGSGMWTVRTENGKSGRGRWLVLASGLLHRTHTPTFPGIERYKGVVHHSGAWPEDLSVKGKKVAIIGAGATSVQIVQELGKEAEQLTMLMRRPSYCLPMGQRQFTKEEQDAWRGYYPMMFEAGRNSAVGFPTKRMGKSVQEVEEEEREKHWEETWKQGGFHFMLQNYNNVLLDPEANELVYNFWKKYDPPVVQKVHARMTDPRKAELMAPSTAPYYFGTKRSPLEMDYYEILDQPNVDIVDLTASPMSTFTESGIQMKGEDSPREFDYVVLATGFDSFTGSLTSMGLKNKDGVDIKEVWGDGVKTYLGMMMHGFPNAFMVYSPQAPTALSNGPTILEAQTTFICDTIVALRNQGLKSLEPTVAAEEEWKTAMNAMNEYTLYKYTDSWWNGSNIPGKKRENMTFIGGIDNYEMQCRSKMAGWIGFDVVPASGAAKVKMEEGSSAKEGRAEVHHIESIVA